MADTKHYYVYILASQFNGALYIGMTDDLIKRVYNHRQKVVEGFTKKYNITRLVYYEIHGSPEGAIRREKQMKKWKRDWKKNLIEQNNLYWEDLYAGILGQSIGAKI